MKGILKIVFLTCFFVSCCSKAQNYSDQESLSKLTKRIDVNKSVAAEAKNYIVNNEIYVFKLWKPFRYNDTINWDVNPYQNKSWRLYFQSLRMLGFLAEDYKYSKDVANINKSKEIIYSWYNHNKTTFEREPVGLFSDVWTDHAVANRVLNLLHVYFTYPKEKELRDKILEMLKFHAEWLYSDSNYTQGNHAVMIDRALLQVAELFNFEERNQWREKAIKRLDNILKIEVTDEGVCTENSPGYHLYVLDLLIEIKELFITYNLKYNNDWDDKINKMKLFAEDIIKPNKTMPVIGDTYYTKYPMDLIKKYGISNGLADIDPIYRNETFKAYPKSGYFIYKENATNNLESIKAIDRTYLSFINTNLNPVHKHNDFMSITLVSNNEDLITDAGHLGYEKNSISEFVRSTFAHSGITVNNQEFNFKEISSEDVKIDDFVIKENYAIVESSLKSEGYLLKRVLLVVKPNFILISDSVIGLSDNNEFELNQIFNLGSSLYKIQEEVNNHWVLNFNYNDLVFKQYIEPTKVEVFSSKIEFSEFLGINTRGYGKAIDGEMIIFSKKAKNNKAQMLTLIEVKNSNYNKPLGVKLVEDKKQITIMDYDNNIIHKLLKD